MGLLGVYLGQNGTVIYSAQNGILVKFVFLNFGDSRKYFHTLRQIKSLNVT